jgi:hypothetical protein
MASVNTVKVTLQVRHDTAENWVTRNPILGQGEYGLEADTFLLKIGDGVRPWINLPYLNKLDPNYFQISDGIITFSDNFQNTIDTLEAAAGQAIENLTIINPPVNDTDVPNKKYVDDAIAGAGHLKRAIVANLPTAASADPNTLYMVLAQSGDHYEEYMIINGSWDMVGSTGDGGSGGFTLEIATNARLGGVKSSTAANYIAVDENTGFMTLNQVSTSLLYVPTGDTLVLYGGNA